MIGRNSPAQESHMDGNGLGPSVRGRGPSAGFASEARPRAVARPHATDCAPGPRSRRIQCAGIVLT